MTSGRQGCEKTQDEDQRKERWQEHWAEVFQGKIIEFHRSVQGGTHERCPELDLSPEAMELSIARCRRHTATGRDLLSNEVMQAGGRPMAELASEIKIADTERWPKEFQGGRATELFKKGSPLKCDDYRDILLANHLAELVLHQFPKPIKPVYDARMPAVQMGAVSKRGTDFGTYMLTSFIESRTSDNDGIQGVSPHWGCLYYNWGILSRNPGQSHISERL